MKPLRTLILIAFVLSPFTGCVAPGSAIGHVSLRGSLESHSGEGLADRKIQFILPATYGLGGLDLVLHKPEDFGHHDHYFGTVTDANGQFSYDLGMHVYHADCWILPPVGCFPKAPPPPLVLMRVPSFPDEHYAIDTRKGQFKVFTVTRHERPLAEAALAELKAHAESLSKDGVRSTVGIINLRYHHP